MTDDLPHKIINCKNRICREFLCRSDGTFLFVENLEVLPKVKKNSVTRASIVKTLICPKCGWETTVGLKKPPTETKPPIKEGRKFLIFRSRF